MHTIKANDHKETGTELSVWTAEDGSWVGCWHGTYRGLYSESDDFELEARTKNEALEELASYYQDWREDWRND